LYCNSQFVGYVTETGRDSEPKLFHARNLCAPIDRPRSPKTKVHQESMADAKVSARQQCVHEGP